MKTTSLFRGLMIAGVFTLVLSARAQVLELRATINAQQETTTSTSPATGTAVMFYNVATNRFDLVVTIKDMANTATASHIHEGAAGESGGVVTNLGGESVYTREGNTLTATFRDVVHGGDKLKLIQGGAYFNIHSAQFAAGEVRGQLIPQPKKLVSNFSVAQEAAAFPNTNFAGLADFGAAVMLYNPATNMISVRMSLFNFNNPFTNSHFHEGAPGVSGPVRLGLGTNANAGNYSSANGHIAGTVDMEATGIDPIVLLTGGLYLNFHSSAFPTGELRGQVRASDELLSTRFSNMSVRGYVGTGDQVLIEGITVSGPDPIRALVTVKGPALANYGISGFLPNPRVSLHDSAGRIIAWNDDVGSPLAGDLAITPGVPTNAVESALAVVLPPGNYTAVVSGNGGTGIAILEVTDMRNTGLTATASGTFDQSLAGSPVRPASSSAPELCGVPLPVATMGR